MIVEWLASCLKTAQWFVALLAVETPSEWGALWEDASSMRRSGAAAFLLVWFVSCGAMACRMVGYLMMAVMWVVETCLLSSSLQAGGHLIFLARNAVPQPD
ncbi:MAG TPA: hypothetical protein VH540_01735 [Ktedonobacterales bacterium]|jgi:hypothetical protein